MIDDEWTQIRQRDKNHKCICKKCEECFLYRDWPATDKAGNSIGIKKACSIEVQSVTLRTVIGSIDGAQQAANEARNRSMEAKEEISQYTQACFNAFKLIASKMRLLGRK